MRKPDPNEPASTGTTPTRPTPGTPKGVHPWAVVRANNIIKVKRKEQWRVGVSHQAPAVQSIPLIYLVVDKTFPGQNPVYVDLPPPPPRVPTPSPLPPIREPTPPPPPVARVPTPPPLPPIRTPTPPRAPPPPGGPPAREPDPPFEDDDVVPAPPRQKQQRMSSSSSEDSPAKKQKPDPRLRPPLITEDPDQQQQRCRGRTPLSQLKGFAREARLRENIRLDTAYTTNRGYFKTPADRKGRLTPLARLHKEVRHYQTSGEVLIPPPFLSPDW